MKQTFIQKSAVKAFGPNICLWNDIKSLYRKATESGEYDNIPPELNHMYVELDDGTVIPADAFSDPVVRYGVALETAAQRSGRSLQAQADFDQKAWALKGYAYLVAFFMVVVNWLFHPFSTSISGPGSSVVHMVNNITTMFIIYFISIMYISCSFKNIQIYKGRFMTFKEYVKSGSMFNLKWPEKRG